MIAWIACSLPVMQLLYFVMSKDQSVDINEENNDTVNHHFKYFYHMNYGPTFTIYLLLYS